MLLIQTSRIYASFFQVHFVYDMYQVSLPYCFLLFFCIGLFILNRFLNVFSVIQIIISHKTIFTRYFEDPEVLRNVPKLFLLLGGIFASLQIIGLLLIQVRSKYEIEQSEKCVYYASFCQLCHLCQFYCFLL